MRFRLLALFALLAATPALAEEAPLKQPGRWAQDYTGRAADPAVLFGTLPNGLRYAVMRNTTPSDGVAMRLRIGAGSMVERDEEQGLAHFLEHMAFRGSANVPDGEVVRLLERQGLRFGADTNAFTAQDQTVYTFTFPRGDAAALDTGFTLFREIGERLALDPAAIEAEKGVILSEERLRDSPGFRALKANLGNTLAGTRAVARWPIGTVATIKGATAERLRRFYRANYRPDNATLVVVGAVDPAAVVAAIRARFADWQAGAAPDRLDPGSASPAYPVAEYAEPGSPDQLTLSWVSPVDRRAETTAVDREEVLRQLALRVVNNRLADRAAQPGSPFVAADAANVRALLGTAAVGIVGINAAPEKWGDALDAVVAEQRALLRDGVSAAELHRAVTMLRTTFAANAAAAPTRKSAEIADGIVRETNQDQLYTSPQQDLALVGPVLDAVTPDAVNSAVRALFAGKGPVLFRSTQGAAVGETALGARLASALARPLGARAAQAAVVWPYTRFGALGRVVARSSDAALGTTTLRFANGTRLLVKTTPFQKEHVYVVVALGDGRTGTALPLAHALWAADLLPVGGTGQLGAGDIARWAQGEGRVIGTHFATGMRSFRLGATTRQADLVPQLQLFAALARDPGFRPELGEKLKALGPMLAGQLASNPGLVFARGARGVLTGGDPRFADLPGAQDIAATGAEDLPALLRAPLGGVADITIVGDVSLLQAIDAVQRTFGALPPAPRRPALPPAAITMPAPRGEPFVFAHGGRADQALIGRYWRLPDWFADPHTAHVADVAAALLQARLIDTVREKLGMTYSPSVRAMSSADLVGFGYFSAVIETPPANFAAFRTTVAAELASLAAQPVSADALDRAIRPLREARAKDMENNAFWAGVLPEVLRDPRMRALVQQHVSGVAGVTAADVQAFVRRWLAADQGITIEARAK